MSSITSSHSYTGDLSTIDFCYDAGLSVVIDTDRLHMRSIQPTDILDYASLYGDEDVMEKFATGATKSREETETRTNVWIKRWKIEKDPYSSFTVFKEDEFVGNAILWHGDKPGQSELGYLFMKKHWKNGYGTEAVSAIVREYAPATVEEGFVLEGKTLNEITATARVDNPASAKILTKVGMEKTKEEEKFGALRYHFSMKV